MVILVPIGCRSDESLTRYVRTCKKCVSIQLTPNDWNESYEAIEQACEAYQVEWVLITGDRYEMLAAAMAAFHNGAKIAHAYSGVKNSFATGDDYYRHMISIISDVQFAENKKCKQVVKQLCKAIGKKSRVKVTGITHLDGATLDESMVPEEPYNLVLYNPCTKKKEIFIGPNPDKTYENLPQEQYLALVKHCDEFITNSSSAIYEAPFLMDGNRIIMIGDRNKNRTRDRMKLNGSKKILKRLEK